MNALLLALVIVAAALVGSAHARVETPAVTVSGDSVAVEATDTRLSDLLLKLREQTGARLLVESALARDVATARVTASFAGLRMEEALRRLLGGRNFVLLYGGAGIDEIRVYAEGKTGYSELGAGSPSGVSMVSRKTLGTQPTSPLAPPPPRPADDPKAVARWQETALRGPDAAGRVEALEELTQVDDAKVLADTLVEVLARERDGRVLETALNLVDERMDAIPPGALMSFVTSDRDGASRAQALELLAGRDGSGAAMLTTLETLAKNDASPEVREAAEQLMKVAAGPPPPPSSRQTPARNSLPKPKSGQ